MAHWLPELPTLPPFPAEEVEVEEADGDATEDATTEDDGTTEEDGTTDTALEDGAT